MIMVEGVWYVFQTHKYTRSTSAYIGDVPEGELTQMLNRSSRCYSNQHSISETMASIL